MPFATLRADVGVDLVTGSMASGRQSDIGANTSCRLKRVGSSIVALKQSAAIGPIPGTLMNVLTCAS
jgi:hypothetical protein